MPQRRVRFTRGSYYHLYNRGANRMSIVRSDLDYHLLLQKLKVYCAELSLTLIAYCLLPNHYHWLVRQERDMPAGLLPQKVFNSYAKLFNFANNRTGTLFEGRYKAILVESDAYLLHLCRYIHANPVRHGIASDVALWPYSNYLDWIGERQGTLVDRSFIQQHFPTPHQYQVYVRALLSGVAQIPQNLDGYLQELESE